MPTVAVNAPRTPVTEGSLGMASATIPNICMVDAPVPLPNIGLSAKLPMLYTITVRVESWSVCVRGSYFASEGDVESKPTGGGVISSNVEGWTKFLGLGSFNVRFEGRNVQLLGDAMTNNNGPSGMPPNAATLPGIMQAPLPVVDP